MGRFRAVEGRGSECAYISGGGGCLYEGANVGNNQGRRRRRWRPRSEEIKKCASRSNINR